MKDLKSWHVGSSSLTKDSTQDPCIGRVEFQPLDHRGRSASFIFCHLTEPNYELSIQEVLCKCWCLCRSKTTKMTDQSSSLLLSASTSPHEHYIYFVAVVQLLSHIWLFVTPWTAALQASLSFIISQSLLKLMSIESVMPSNHLILCRPLLLLRSIFPSIRVFSSESAIHIR